ncbi:TIGR02996 domain-containing protein [Pyxidicoccus sp. 3LFB2]
MSDALDDLLARAAEAFERHEELESFQFLLNAWRQRREARVATLVERLSARLTGHPTPLQYSAWSLTMKEHHPLEVPGLLATSMKTVDGGLWGHLPTELHILTQGSSDPRLTPVLLDLVFRPAALDGHAFRALCRAFKATKDPRALEPLQALRLTLPSDFSQTGLLDEALQAIAAGVPPPLDTATLARCMDLEQALSEREAAEARSASTRELLLARVYAAPRDTAARMVLADHLIENGMPRGELIMLQCMPRSDRARIERLLETNAWQWETPLGSHVARGSIRFERGFPFAVRLRRDWSGPLPEPGRVWRTVREVDLAGTQFLDAVKWLSHENLDGVTILRRVAPLIARTLASQGLGVRQLGLPDAVPPGFLTLFKELLRLPRLTRLFIRNATLTDVYLCVDSGLASRLERFDARAPGQWALVVTPSKEVPVRATLVGSAGAYGIAGALHAARSVSTRGVRIQGAARAPPETQQMLRNVVSGYARVEWR